MDLLLASLATLQEGALNDDQGRLHPFIAKALASPHAIKANFFVTAEGRVVRSSVHVKKEGIPDWVHAMADEKIGQGEDLEYEVEVYPDGTQVYEVYRKVDGKERQLSAAVDRTVYYIGLEQDVASLPAEAASTLAKLEGFEAKRCVLKEGATFHEYHVKGTLNGGELRARLGKDGRLIALQRRLPSAVEVELPPLKPAKPAF